MERTLLGASKRGREPMNEKNGGMAQRGMVAERGILRNQRRNNNSPATPCPPEYNKRRL
jgi:hypothetical protein